jgi:hypothetical protein
VEFGWKNPARLSAPASLGKKIIAHLACLLPRLPEHNLIRASGWSLKTARNSAASRKLFLAETLDGVYLDK